MLRAIGLFASIILISCGQQSSSKLFSLSSPSYTPYPIYTEDFEAYPHNARYEIEGLNVEDNCGINKSKCLVASYVPTNIGSPRLQYKRKIRSAPEYTLHYDIKFHKNFEFVKGGKLPGFSPKDHVTGCRPMTKDKWSSRLMWQRQGQLILYLYHQNKERNCGQGYKTKKLFKFKKNRYYHIALHQKVNSDEDTHDGSISLYVNDKLLVEVSDLQFRGDANHSNAINSFFFSSFFGGSTSDWSPSQKVTAYFDNIAIYPGKHIKVAKTSTSNQPQCVWNQAYQENYSKDQYKDILENASGCYTLIDPFGMSNKSQKISDLKVKNNTVGCYISVGTCEQWRQDFNNIKPYCVEKQWGEWPGEYFVSETNTGILPHMKARLTNLANIGCDVVEFDNMDWGFSDSNRSEYGIKASKQDVETYNQALCEHSRSLGMKCMAKSTTRGAYDFDGLTVESYTYDLNWWNEKHMKDMLAKGSPGIIVHYDEPDCDTAYAYYTNIYGYKLSFICEDPAIGGYRHYNQQQHDQSAPLWLGGL